MVAPSRVAIAAALVLPWAAPAPTFAAPRPNICSETIYVRPAAGSTVPANLPAFMIVQGTYTGLKPRPLNALQFELHDGSGALIPSMIEARDEWNYLVRPMSTLPVGEVVLSYMDDCPNGSGKPRLNPPVRNDTHRYTITPAAAFPVRIGTVATQVTGYHAHSTSCHRPIFADVRFQIEPTPEIAAFAPALLLERRFDGGAPEGGLEGQPRGGPFVFEFGLPCTDDSGLVGNGIKTRTFEFRARLPGAALTIEPLRARVDIDCTDRRVDAGEGIEGCPTGSEPPPSTEARDGGVGRAGESAMNEGRGGGLGCRLGSADPPGIGSLLIVGVLALLRRFRR